MILFHMGFTWNKNARSKRESGAYVTTLPALPFIQIYSALNSPSTEEGSKQQQHLFYDLWIFCKVAQISSAIPDLEL